ncbi:MAG: cation transporter [Thermoanaerobaculaceae bacterium]|nr:cation transporter [Thermoanaerobaculaceae bacterium]
MNKKIKTATISLLASLFLTLGKGTVGFLTGSLGLISEALHSLLDFSATALTLFAVSKSSKPPDEEHTFGHGKIENISALFETLLLVFTSGWVIYEGIKRLIYPKEEIIVNVWSYAVIISSIIIDFWRSRALYKTAKETRSAALEADALHFSSDIGSSFVVLTGLLSTQIGFRQADSIAAIVVSILVLYISFKLGMASINTLIDAVPQGALQKIDAAASKVNGVCKVYGIRVRESGETYFIEMKVAINSNLPLNEVHRITSDVEEKIKKVFPQSQVLVHPEPSVKEEGIYEYALRVSESFGARLHDFTLLESGSALEVSIHLEWEGETLFTDAWNKAKTVEKEIQKKFGDSITVFVHFEPSIEKVKHSEEKENIALQKQIKELIKKLKPPLSESRAKIIESEGKGHIHLEFPVEPTLKIEEVHQLSSALENEVSKIAPQNSHTLAQPVPKDEFYK